MKADLKKKWVAALRSETFLQAQGRLQDESGRFCCLGVLCQVAGIRINSSGAVTVDEAGNPTKYTPIVELLGDISPVALYRLNDTLNLTFPKIADWIEENVNES